MSQPHDSLDWQLAGYVGLVPVFATYSAGILVCDDELRVQAQLLVDLGVILDTAMGLIPATLTGPSTHVFITLCRAENVTWAAFSFDDQA